MEIDSAAARIREAAIDQFGRTGFAGTTVRAIAARAGVSPALIMHHFGTKDGLIEHCDGYVLAHVERLRGDFLRGETKIDSVTGYLADRPELLPMTRYLSQALMAGGAAGRSVFDRMIDVARSNLETGIEVGRIRPTDDLEARAAVLAAWNAAVIMLGDAIAARLDADNILDPAIVDRVQATALDIYTRGLLINEESPDDVRS
ncbi:TetR family transcriptional regulator [Microlunatus speluncae]|uniref:TetR family transcriptional regulator n=1 Tax=Microlunatus speluncae TaxID=2594267 RepID=UPI00126671F5|nr:TetR family transcriptional regulator [Microlunatus speluncae]